MAAHSGALTLDPRVNDIIPLGATIEKLAEGFGLAEGPVWSPEGYLLFSDVVNNVIHKWTSTGGVSVYRQCSGYTADTPSEDYLYGSNGLTLDTLGRLTACQHGNRRVVRLEHDGREVVLADRFEGKKLNSPNDLVYRSDGAIYFTDPPALLQIFRPPEGGFGFKTEDDPRKELPFSGVYRAHNGKVQLLYKELPLPNGIAFSPDEKYLYVNDSIKKVYMRFEVRSDGTIVNGQIFCDMSPDSEPGVPDGMKIDQTGNVYGTGPGGFWILSPEGKHLGTVRTPEPLSNLAWGDDGKTLYMTGHHGLYRIRLKIPGLRPKVSMEANVGKNK